MGKYYPYWYALETGKGDLPPRPRKPVPIQVVGVWDTVGAIRTSLLQPYPGEVNRLSLPDGALPRNVKVALHAVAFHENRNWFQTTLWEEGDEFGDAGNEGPAEGQILKQVWFGGEHSDVGGGWDSHELADISLFWMASECEPYASFDTEMLLQSIKHPRPTPDNPKPKPKPAWGASIPHNSYMHTPQALALLGHILPSTRLQGGHFQRNSLFHSSILHSPRPRTCEILAYEMGHHHIAAPGEHLAREDTALSPTARSALAGGEAAEEDTNILSAMGKYMITLEDLQKHFGAGWRPRVVQLNPLELRARQLWMEMSQKTDHKATYESYGQLEHVLHDSPVDAAKISIF